MKPFIFYYYVMESNGTKERANCVISFSDEKAVLLMENNIPKELPIYSNIETILTERENLKGRLYIKDSILGWERI